MQSDRYQVVPFPKIFSDASFRRKPESIAFIRFTISNLRKNFLGVLPKSQVRVFDPAATGQLVAFA